MLNGYDAIHEGLVKRAADLAGRGENVVHKRVWNVDSRGFTISSFVIVEDSHAGMYLCRFASQYANQFVLVANENLTLIRNSAVLKLLENILTVF